MHTSFRSSRTNHHHSGHFVARHSVLLIALVLMVALLAASIASPITGAAPPPNFADQQTFAVGNNPFSVTVGDLNGDGRLDLAVANQLSANVSVLLNTTAPGASTPSFAPKQDFATQTEPVSVAVGDVNGDSRLDLVVANSGANTVSVLLNTTAAGTATLTFPVRVDFVMGTQPQSVAMGDLNGDGRLDLVVAMNGDDTVSVRLNTTAPGAGMPSFAPPQPFATGNEPISVSLGDLNGDGRLDLAVSNLFDATVSVLLNTTDPSADMPSFATHQTFGTGAQPTSVKVGDLNQDGRLDLAVTNAGPGTVSVLLNTTASGATVANFASHQTFNTGLNPQSVAVGDVNGDGNLDLVVSNLNDATVSVLSNTTAQGAATPSFDTQQTFATGAFPQSVTMGDLNGDGKPDLAVANTGPDTVSVLLNSSAITPAIISLSSANYPVNESTGFVTITVNRTGDLSIPVTVDYTTNDVGASDVCSTPNSGLASSRCDFGLTLGTLNFAATETQTFVIPITQDSYTEGVETFALNLSNLTGSGAAFATSSATVTISDSAAPAPNASDNTDAFVRQHYRDFLNREADPAGLAFWTDQIDNCTPKPQCTELRRINASAAFFLSIEFQTTGNLVRSFYVAALNRPATNNMPEIVEFVRDTQFMQRGLIVDPNNDWQTVLANNRDAFARDFVTRTEFVGLYPTTDTPPVYVDKLYGHAGIMPTSGERDNTIEEFGGDLTAADAGARGRALLRVTQNAAFQAREINRSFVQMQYFGYLRRNPNDPPDGDFAGYNFWLTKLNAAGGNFVDAEMVKAFIVSGEYRSRFGP